MIDDNILKDENDINEKLSSLEEMATEELLIELLNEKKAEVFENIVFQGQRRYYIEDLTERDYLLENTTPYQIEIMGYVIEEHVWGKMICAVTNLLLRIFPSYKDKILTFACPWSKAKMISEIQKTNYRGLECGYYINCNHTALHSCWFIQDLFDFFMIDKSTVHFLIHRPSSAEPKHVKDYIEQRFKKNYSYYIQSKTGKGVEYSNKVISLTEKYLNLMLQKISKSYTNLFLFDDNATLYNYAKKIREMVAVDCRFDEKARRILNKYLDYLMNFYRESN